MNRSDRWSARDGEPDRRHAGIPAFQPINAPEWVAVPVRTPGTPERRVQRLSARALAALRKGMTDRERAILEDVDHYRFLTTRQIERLHFTDFATPASGARIARRVLKRIADERIIEHLERRVGGVRAGSASYIWRLGPVGERLLREPGDVRVRRKEPSIYFLDHCLAVAECAIRLQDSARDGGYELPTLTVEPASWRSYIARGGYRETLKPDLYVVTASGEFEDSWFIEVDRGTESIPTLIRKCRQYLAYRQSGIEQDERGVFPLVLWVLTDEGRVERFTEAMRTARSFDASLFRTVTTEHVAEAIAGGAL